MPRGGGAPLAQRRARRHLLQHCVRLVRRHATGVVARPAAPPKLFFWHDKLFLKYSFRLCLNRLNDRLKY
jgi:hypothetical protein